MLAMFCRICFLSPCQEEFAALREIHVLPAVLWVDEFTALTDSGSMLTRIEQGEYPTKSIASLKVFTLDVVNSIQFFVIS